MACVGDATYCVVLACSFGFVAFLLLLFASLLPVSMLYASSFCLLFAFGSVGVRRLSHAIDVSDSVSISDSVTPRITGDLEKSRDTLASE